MTPKFWKNVIWSIDPVPIKQLPLYIALIAIYITVYENGYCYFLANVIRYGLTKVITLSGTVCVSNFQTKLLSVEHSFMTLTPPSHHPQNIRDHFYQKKNFETKFKSLLRVCKARELKIKL
jgi:hypothetical protein